MQWQRGFTHFAFAIQPPTLLSAANGRPAALAKVHTSRQDLRLMMIPVFALAVSNMLPKKRCRSCGLEWRGHSADELSVMKTIHYHDDGKGFPIVWIHGF